MDVSQWVSEDFLDVVWGDRQGWVDIPTKVGQYWVPYHIKWPNEGVATLRLDAANRDEENVYFSCGMFRERGRNYDDLLKPAWLWADLDEVSPEVVPVPTLAWESSTERYQAMWKLTRSVKPEVWERLNQALSYSLGADKGGWDRTQVLRLPGTFNYKYPDHPPVRVMWYKPELMYSPRSIWDMVKGHALPVRAVGSGQLAKRPMPGKARALLRVPSDAVVAGERSDRMWELECLLAEAGWGEDEIYEAVSESAWNKWAGSRLEERQLRREIGKAIRHVGQKVTPMTPPLEGSKLAGPTEEPERFPSEHYDSFLAKNLPDPKWLVEDVWTAGSHGIIGGDPKTSKTGLALALALAVSSGKPFLGKYRVHTPGPVWFVQQENAPWMIQDRLRKLAYFYKLIPHQDVVREKADPGALGGYTIDIGFPENVPLRFSNNEGLNLSDEDHREMFENELKMQRPALVIIDPLYLAFGGADTDRATQMYPFIAWLLEMSNTYSTAIALVHHFGKKPTAPGSAQRRAGQRLLGSTTLHGWVDSALYCEHLDEDRPGWVGARVEPEFRSMAPRKPIEVHLRWGAPGELGMKCEVKRFDLTEMIVEAVTEEPGVTVVRLAERLGWDRRTVLGRARDSEMIEVTGGRGGRGGRGQSYRLFPNGNESD